MMFAADSKVVLVVDDEVFARLFAVQIFLDEGFTVLEAADAHEGLAVLEDNDDVSLLFTDLSMPGTMDGMGLIEKVRADRPDICLVATSGLVSPTPDKFEGGGRFLPKPYTAHALMETIRQVSAECLHGSRAA